MSDFEFTFALFGLLLGLSLAEVLSGLAHFFRVRRTVIGVMLALLAAQLLFYMSVPELSERLRNPLALALTAVLVALMIAAMTVRGQIWSRIAMTALVARYVVVYLL